MDMYISSMESLVDLTSRTDPFCHFGGNTTSPFWRLDELATLSSHNHGSVENYPKWKEPTIGDTPIFHWTMSMGGSGNWHWVSSSIVKSCEPETTYFWILKGKKTRIPPNHRLRSPSTRRDRCPPWARKTKTVAPHSFLYWLVHRNPLLVDFVWPPGAQQ